MQGGVMGGASLRSGSEKRGVTSQEALLSGCVFIREGTFIGNLKKYDRAQCGDGRAQLE